MESIPQVSFLNLQYCSKGNFSLLLMQIPLLRSMHNLDEEYAFYFQIDLEDFSTPVNKGISNLNPILS